MKEVHMLGAERYGFGFVAPEFLEAGRDEFWLRDIQVGAQFRTWRHLKSSEIEELVKNDNSCPDWDLVFVSDPFVPALIKNTSFFGLVRIGKLENAVLAHHDLRLPVGIWNSTIISCDIGDDCVIRDCPYISHYIVGDNVVLANIDEMQTTDHAKFGNGVVKDGESESVRIRIDVMNEAGGRSILPFDGMICADAYLWAAYRDDGALMDALEAMTQLQFGGPRGSYGVVGSYSVVKSVRIIKDVAVGECAYIKGANKLKNLTINSSEAEPTQIGEGVELVNGIIGFGCRVFYGCKAVRFVMGSKSSLKYGARLIHSVLGDNSTVSCCEMLNNLVFPAHEQHHNNSFLIASLVGGQSNMAAGATIGSNHNSRAPDGELRAGRGFWPGLCVTLKHSSRFASFTLIAKGDYPNELDIPFPFALVNNDVHSDRLEVMPAYFWMHNLYALERNAWKIGARDGRVHKVQFVEADYLAPDTAEEMLRSLALLEAWTAGAWLLAGNEDPSVRTPGELRSLGRSLLLDSENRVQGLEVVGEGVERSGRPCVILKPRKSYRAYRHMLRYYAVRRILDAFEAAVAVEAGLSLGTFLARMSPRGQWAEGGGYSAAPAPRSLADGDQVAGGGAGDPSAVADPSDGEPAWINLGGQIVRREDLDRLRARIRGGELGDWAAVHRAYADIQEGYRDAAALHAAAVLDRIGEDDGRVSPLDGTRFARELDGAAATRRWMDAQVFETRKKDHEDPFRTMTYRNAAEMEAILGRPEDNPFVRQTERETESFLGRVKAAAERL